MAFPIPKIEYKNGSTTGTTTNGSGTLTSVGDTSDMEAGMFISGTGVPTGATIESVTTTTVTLASGAVCTSTNPSSTLSFGHRIEFEYPPKEPKGEARDTKATVSESLSGIRQVSVNYIEGTRNLLFSFLSPTIYALLETFLDDHALLGDEFRYYEDKTLSTYVDYELDTFKVEPKKIAPRSETTYVWEVPLKFRRVI